MRTSLKTLLLLALMSIPATAALADHGHHGDPDNRKIQICHFPPGNPANFHTIRVKAKAWAKHERHGDLLGSCMANCEAICGDDDPCTQDVESDTNHCICLPVPVPVSCDDGVDCTIDSCDPVDGSCVAVNACDDANPCTADICSTGECTFPPVTGCIFPPVADGELCDDGDPGTIGDQCLAGVCMGSDPCDGVVCEALDQCHVAGTCTDGVCDDPVAADGTACDDGDAETSDDVCTAGVCAGTAGSVCDPNPCLNDGVCGDNGDGTFSCDCPWPWEGPICEALIFCDVNPNPCQNDGTCIGDGVGGFSCDCQWPWIGPTCEGLIFCEINPNPCQNSGTCIDDGVGGYSCDCASGWTGEHCEVPV